MANNDFALGTKIESSTRRHLNHSSPEPEPFGASFHQTFKSFLGGDNNQGIIAQSKFVHNSGYLLDPALKSGVKVPLQTGSPTI